MSMKAIRRPGFAHYAGLLEISLRKHSALNIYYRRGGPMLKVKVGDTAPNFTLPSQTGARVTLSQYRGKKNVVLTFYPLDWTPV